MAFGSMAITAGWSRLTLSWFWLPLAAGVSLAMVSGLLVFSVFLFGAIVVLLELDGFLAVVVSDEQWESENARVTYREDCDGDQACSNI